MLLYPPTKDQTANNLTMSLSLDKFVKIQNKLGIVSRLTIEETKVIL